MRHLESTYTFLGGCKDGLYPCSSIKGMLCGDYPEDEACRDCSLEECMELAIDAKSYALAYRGTGIKWCRLCDESDFEKKQNISETSRTWGVYIRSNASNTGNSSHTMSYTYISLPIFLHIN